jgi:peptidoglycan/LPS O-acetylase OafA/YrhL
MEGMIPADKLAAPATHSTTALRSYIPALDGVRGLAILVVMFCHFVWIQNEVSPPPDGASRMGMELLKTGRYGVDLFFVLSGFLITGILYDAKSDKHYFRNFYARRTLRIFPLYYSVLLIMFVLAPLFVSWNTPGERRIVENQWWLWTYLGNIKSAFVGPGFFQEDRIWMGHFWSLAIEEQFYLVWPLVILLLSRRQAIVACAVMVLGVPLLRVMMMRAFGLNALLYFTLCKLDTLALGALLALCARSPGGLVRFAKAAPYVFVLSGMLLAPLVLPKFKPDKDTLFGALAESGKLSLICFFCGSLLTLAVSSTPRQLFGWVFTLPIMRFFGKYSYGLYIFHELLAPLFNGPLGIRSLDARLGLGWHVSLLLHILLSGLIAIAVSLLSWHVMEKHMLKLKRFFEHAPEPRPTKREPSAPPDVDAPANSGAVPARPAASVALQTTSGRMAG